MNENLKKWARAAGVRAIKTAAQTAVAMIPVGVAITEVGWIGVVSTAALAGLVSLLSSVAGIPEVDEGTNAIKIAKEG